MVELTSLSCRECDLARHAGPLLLQGSSFLIRSHGSGHAYHRGQVHDGNGQGVGSHLGLHQE